MMHTNRIGRNSVVYGGRIGYRW